MTTVKATIKAYAKALTALSGLATQALAEGVVPEPYKHWVQLALGALAVVGVHQVPNTPKPASVD